MRALSRLSPQSAVSVSSSTQVTMAVPIRRPQPPEADQCSYSRGVEVLKKPNLSETAPLKLPDLCGTTSPPPPQPPTPAPPQERPDPPSPPSPTRLHRVRRP